MLVRFPSDSQLADKDRELVLELAEHFFPGVQHIEQLSSPQRAWWVSVQVAIARGEQGLVQATRRVLSEAEEVEVQPSEMLDSYEQLERTRVEFVESDELEARREQKKAWREIVQGIKAEHERETALKQAAARHRKERLLEKVRATRRRSVELPSREAPLPGSREIGLFRSREAQLIPPPPPSPTYDRLFGNQIRWALHVIRYSLQQRRLKLTDPESK